MHVMHAYYLYIHTERRVTTGSKIIYTYTIHTERRVMTGSKIIYTYTLIAILLLRAYYYSTGLLHIVTLQDLLRYSFFVRIIYSTGFGYYILYKDTTC